MNCASDASRTASVVAAAHRLAPPGVRFGVGPGRTGEAAAFRAAVRRLAEALAEAHPEAGPAFPAARVWAHVVWQPALLAVIGAERFGLALRLRDIGQRIGRAGAEGARICGRHSSTPPEDLRRTAAAELSAAAAAAFEAVSEAAPLRRPFAWRLLADRVAGLLALPEAHPPGTPAHARAEAASRWSAHLGLAPARAPALLAEACGALRLERAACCLEFRRAGGAVCDGCPKRRRRTPAGAAR